MNTKIIKAAWLSEIQAIAIYEAEVKVLRLTAVTAERKMTLDACEHILKEELAHSSSLEGYLSQGVSQSLEAKLSRLAGTALGLALSLAPSKISWKVHAWAERQAAAIYDDAFRRAGLSELKEAREQEQGHAELFDDLLKGISRNL